MPSFNTCNKYEIIILVFLSLIIFHFWSAFCNFSYPVHCLLCRCLPSDSKFLLEANFIGEQPTSVNWSKTHTQLIIIRQMLFISEWAYLSLNAPTNNKQIRKRLTIGTHNEFIMIKKKLKRNVNWNIFCSLYSLFICRTSIPLWFFFSSNLNNVRCLVCESSNLLQSFSVKWFHCQEYPIASFRKGATEIAGWKTNHFYQFPNSTICVLHVFERVREREKVK